MLSAPPVGRDARGPLRTALQAPAVGSKRLKLWVKMRLDSFEPLQIYPFRGYGTPREIHLNGRVIERDGVVHVDEGGGGAWHHLKNTVRRFSSDEIPNARLVARLGPDEVELRTDLEGYFHKVLVPRAPLAPGWHEAEYELLDSIAGGRGLRQKGEVLVAPDDAEFGVISDIDDTVIYSAVTKRLKMLRIVLFHDVKARIPFPGVAAFYRALRRGPTGQGANPIFYVSKSPWNLYDLLEAFFRAHDIPRGPLFLRDLAWLDAPSQALGVEQDKLSRIRRLLRIFATLRLVLWGDSGQKDPEIYAQIAREHPGRIRAIYIRDVTRRSRTRSAEVRRIAAELQALGIPMLLERETVGAALHAVELGLISPDAMDEIRGRTRADIAENEAAGHA